jgi:hypothetical protein
LDVAQLSLRDKQQQEYNVDTAASLTKASARGTNASSIPGRDIAEPMLITEAKYKRRYARRPRRQGRVRGERLVRLSKATGTNTAVLVFGLIAVGKKMVKLISVARGLSALSVGSLSAAISAAIAGISGVAVLAGIAAATAAILLALFLFLKE